MIALLVILQILLFYIANVIATKRFDGPIVTYL